jgi:hypothetical protein
LEAFEDSGENMEDGGMKRNSEEVSSGHTMTECMDLVEKPLPMVLEMLPREYPVL